MTSWQGGTSIKGRGEDVAAVGGEKKSEQSKKQTKGVDPMLFAGCIQSA